MITIAREFGVSTETVRSRLREWGVRLRSHREAVRLGRRASP